MMNRAWRRAMVRRTFLWAWAMATIALVACVGLLAREVTRGGADPLAFMRPEPKAAPASTARTEPAAPMANKEITLYFADAEGKLLAPESARIEAGDSTVENCRKALEALIHGPRDILTPILPASTRIRGLYMIEGGQLVIDFSIEFTRELKKARSTSLESLMVYGVVDTLANDALRGAKEGGVANVRFLVEGSAPHESFPAHLDLSGPIKPDSRWIAGGGA
jgi:spore germination protein GerM